MEKLYSEDDQLKWLLLDEAGENQDIGVAFGAGKLFLGRAGRDVERRVATTLRELHGDGLVVFFRSSWDDGYNIDTSDIVPLSAAEVGVEIQSAADTTYPPDAVLFFRRTTAGSQLIQSLPAGAVPTVSGRVPQLGQRED